MFHFLLRECMFIKSTLLIGLYPYENDLQYSMLIANKLSRNILHGKYARSNILTLINKIKQQHSIRWSNNRINFIVPMEKIIIRNISRPANLNNQELILYIKEKIKELFYHSNEYFYDFQLSKHNSQETIRLFLLPYHYWHNYVSEGLQSKTNRVIFEPETAAIKRFFAHYYDTSPMDGLIYLNKNKIYLHYSNDIKIISSYDPDWLYKIMQFLEKKSTTQFKLITEDEEKAKLMRSIICKRYEFANLISDNESSIEKNYFNYPFSLGGLLGAIDGSY